MKCLLSTLLIGLLACSSFAQVKTSNKVNAVDDGKLERQYCVEVLTRIADPVLNALSKNELRKTMPVESNNSARNYSTHLEAFGRLLSGMAPWLELGPDNTAEGILRKKYIDLAVSSIKNAVDPNAPDFLNFNKGSQPLVDAAFFAQALLRAPNQLWGRLDNETKANVIKALKSSRVITPSYSNWLMFSATIEAALCKFDKSADMMRIDYALKQHQLWYKGDGMYGDGPEFHFDYYNSFVIQPMLIEVLSTLVEANSREADKKLYDEIVRRSQRYAAIQERLISPEGTYPPVGRSLAYRFGAFHLLSKIAYMHALPKEVEPQQVRAAVYTVIKRQIEASGTFDQNGWLQVGYAGHQPGMGENYISTGSLYLCSEAFIILGLPQSDALWQGKDLPWTSKKLWSGENLPVDHAYKSEL
ncbi:MAG: DUF2264 domain-containing protein [Bacteroidota bacterium]|nr:DUF2264 domain-containing protein [Bacteroidota bacterium]